MPDETLLSDLCSICNVNKSKYKCPGCSARTCSLPCYKRHQQWAQCSGQRDRTKFVKKAQLVTPAGIDHDYNFLTEIERDIEKAEHGLANSDDSTTRGSWSHQQKTDEVKYQLLEASSGVIIIRAPKGLSRQMENKTQRSNKKRSSGRWNIKWTVEWLDDQKQRQLTQTSSSCTLLELDPFRAHDEHKDKKRKRNTEPSFPTSFSNIQHDKPSREYQTQSIQPVQPVELDVNVNIKDLSQEREHSSPGARRANVHETESGKPKAHVEEAHRTNPHSDGSNAEPLGDGEHRFYLVKPRTNTNRTVLIPLNPTATLADCLTGRTVLEFPTIHVLTHSGDSLPDGFMLEEKYLKQEGEEHKEFNELIADLDPEILRRLKDDAQQSTHQPPKEERLDDKEILDVLEKDFGGYV